MAAPPATPIAPPRQAGGRNRLGDVLGQDWADGAHRCGPVIGDGDQGVCDVRGRVLFVRLVLSSSLRQKVVGPDDTASGAMAIAQKRSHGVKVMVWDRHVPPRPFWEQSSRVASKSSPAGL